LNQPIENGDFSELKKGAESVEENEKNRICSQARGFQVNSGIYYIVRPTLSWELASRLAVIGTKS